MPRLFFLSFLLTSLIVFNPATFTSSAAAAELVASGDLVLTFTPSGDGAALTSVADKAAGRELTAQDRVPFFEIVVRKAGSPDDVALSSDAGWTKVEIVAAEGDKPFTLRWSGAKQLGPEAAAFCVTAHAALDPAKNRISWNLEVDSGKEQKTWAIRRVLFPQVALADLGPESELLFPRAAGEVKRNPCAAKLYFNAAYPAGWSTMQFMAYYRLAAEAEPAVGLYFSLHDPLGGNKTISTNNRPDGRSLVLKFDHPAENMDAPGNHFTLSGHAVWQLLRGDWFDAAAIYRNWVAAEAEWYPRLTAEGRADTPQWMRELPVWVMTGGPPETVVPAVEKFAKAVGVPVGVHWYNWHEIPFDNDYPHYFPTKPGFAEAVAHLKAEGIYVMPYINGRLWDSRDRGVEDFQFTSVALTAVTKDEAGKPILESYRSKESDGEPVRLGVMCPATSLWQDKIRETALRLMNECGTGGVYIDQIAAAPPVLCFDRTHGHPTGGGHWWTAGYWQFLDRLREKIPEGHMITTECNAEPFVKWFDGYLTWHWQFDDQEPVFPAVYGGTVQMFGRSYRGELNDNDLATHMKAAQQLVYGEQIGWFDPAVIDREQNAAFIKQIIALRWHLRRYFYAGRMARPPRPLGEIPKVRANWRWTEEWWVENPALSTGAWRLPEDNRVVFFAVNASDQPITFRALLDLADYGLKGEEFRATHLTVDGSMKINESSANVSRRLDRELTIPAKTAWAWEVK